jgi:hypothetical protein
MHPKDKEPASVDEAGVNRAAYIPKVTTGKTKHKSEPSMIASCDKISKDQKK